MFKMFFSWLLLGCIIVFSQFKSCSEYESYYQECKDDLDAAIERGSAFLSIMSSCQNIQSECIDLCQKERDEKLYGEHRRMNEQ